MSMEQLLGASSIILSFEVDSLLFDRLDAIKDHNISMVEINTSDCNLLKKAINNYPHLHVGSNQVTNIQQLEDCYKAGVSFMVSPGFLPAMAQTASIYTMNYIIGVATLSEAMQAHALGCHHIRPYPASLALCTLLYQHLPHLHLYPTDISRHELPSFLRIPSVKAVSMLASENEWLINTQDLVCFD